MEHLQPFTELLKLCINPTNHATRTVVTAVGGAVGGGDRECHTAALCTQHTMQWVFQAKNRTSLAHAWPQSGVAAH